MAIHKIGEILGYGGSTAPNNFLLCDGSAVSRTTYVTLFTEISTTYGAGNGSTTFNLPDMQGYTPVGYKSGDADFGTLGSAQGANSVDLSHSHTISHVHTISGSVAADTTTAANDLDTSSPNHYSAKRGHAHTFPSTTSSAASDNSLSSAGSTTQSILTPFLVANFIIRYRVSPEGASFLFNFA